MIIDTQTTLSLAQTGITTTAASTNYYDAGSQGDAIGSHLWVVVRVNASVTSGSSTGTVQATVETADDTAFSVNKTLLLAGNAVTIPAAGTYLLKAQLGVGIRRYTRINYVNGTEALTGGSFDALIVSDIDDLLNY